jgi:hypothetical protein
MWQSTNLAVEVRLTFDVIAVLHRIDSEDAAPLIGEAKPPLAAVRVRSMRTTSGSF